MKAIAVVLLVLVAGCSSAPQRGSGGGFYKDDGPGDKPPPNLDAIADAVPRSEPLHRFANRPYQALGKQFTPLTTVQPYRERGVASWYGRRYHGQKTSTGETYDMYAMSAAHPTLPLPSYARVTSMANGRSVVVRLNDRGPFLHGRVIDLSYAAAHRLGIVQAGSGEVTVEAIVPGAASAHSASPGAVFVQLGAFSSRENAEALRQRVSRDLARDDPQVLNSGGLWRLQLGPYATRDAANAAAESVEKLYDLKPHLVVK